MPSAVGGFHTTPNESRGHPPPHERRSVLFRPTVFQHRFRGAERADSGRTTYKHPADCPRGKSGSDDRSARQNRESRPASRSFQCADTRTTTSRSPIGRLASRSAGSVGGTETRIHTTHASTSTRHPTPRHRGGRLVLVRLPRCHELHPVRDRATNRDSSRSFTRTSAPG